MLIQRTQCPHKLGTMRFKRCFGTQQTHKSTGPPKPIITFCIVPPNMSILGNVLVPRTWLLWHNTTGLPKPIITFCIVPPNMFILGNVLVPKGWLLWHNTLFGSAVVEPSGQRPRCQIYLPIISTSLCVLLGFNCFFGCRLGRRRQKWARDLSGIDTDAIVVQIALDRPLIHRKYKKNIK